MKKPALNMILLRGLVISIALLTAHSSWAAIYLGQTRLIIDEKDQEVSIRVTNEGDKPALLQTWVDLGEIDANPENIPVPFVITPPIVRINGKKQQRLRIMYSGNQNTLPPDRESAYWLNVLEIPPKSASGASEDKIQLAFRTRIKLFYRPKKVSEMDLSALPKKLHVTLINNNVRIENPTPLNQTLLSVVIGNDRKYPVANVVLTDDMIAPFSTVEYPLAERRNGVNKSMRVFIETINDYGAVEQTELNLTF